MSKPQLRLAHMSNHAFFRAKERLGAYLQNLLIKGKTQEYNSYLESLLIAKYNNKSALVDEYRNLVFLLGATEGGRLVVVTILHAHNWREKCFI